jgi:hypothetical protein
MLGGVAARRAIEHAGMPRAGDALARHRWMDVDHGLSFRASNLSVPLARFRLRPRQQVHRLDIWRCQAVFLFLM